MLHHSLKIALATALTVTLPMAPALASSPVAPDSNAETLISLKFPQAGDRGTTQTSGGGGTRGGTCFTQPNSTLSIVAPTVDTLTATANPNIFVYVPASREDTAGEFVLVDADGNLIHEQSVTIPSGDSILAIAVPEEVTLEPGGEYAWAFAINCTIDNQVVSTAVEAGLTRKQLTPEMEKKIKATEDPLAQANLYASEGIWQDTLTLVAGMPEQREELVELFDSVGLEKLNDVPIIFVGTSPQEN
jgi:hypothetical protein